MAAGFGCTAVNLPTDEHIGTFSSTAPAGWIITGPTKYDGTSCTGNGTGDLGSPAPSTPSGSVADTVTVNNCPIGFFPGIVNGVSVCAPPAPGTPGVSSTPSSTTSTTSTGTGTSTVSTTSQGTTTCTQTSCTTITVITSTPAGGSATTNTTTSTQTKGEFCQAHPADAQCRSSGAFSGQCNTSFSCSGDAIQCAVAVASNKTSCALNTSSPEADLYNASKSATTAPVSSNTVAISSSNFDTTDALAGIGSSTCISDLPVTIVGRPVTIRLSVVCPHLSMLGNIMLGISFIIAFVIVGKGVT